MITINQGNILQHFPKKLTPRRQQVKVILDIEKAIVKDKKYILVQAPTGVGKSAISYAVLRWAGNGYVCTGTKTLQDQYLTEYPDILTAKGRGNFECLERDGNKSCEEGNCQVLKSSCDRKPTLKPTPYLAYFSNKEGSTKYWKQGPNKLIRCPYWVQKTAALNNFAVAPNYDYLLTESNYIREFGQRTILISDEGHNIESKIINFIKIPISVEILDIINKYLQGEKVRFVYSGRNTTNNEKLRLHAAWLNGLNEKIPKSLEYIKTLAKQALTEKEELQKQFSELNSNDSYTNEKRRLLKKEIKAKDDRLDDLFKDQKRITNLQNNQIAFFLEDIASHLDNWVVKEEFLYNGTIMKIEFQPIKIDKYAYDKYLWLGEINIIMSATILDPDRVINDLGLDPTEVEYIEIEPVFPVTNHKIFNLSIANFKRVDEETPAQAEQFFKEVVERIDMILELFPEDRGIIHCVKYEIAEKIQRYSIYKERLITHNSKNRDERLEEHKNTEKSVLLSPSMTEGIDLKDELSRFQILVKIPYLDMNDERIRQRFIVDRPFYDYQAAVSIIQAIGRSIRSEKDYAVTFTLDDRFTWFMHKNHGIMKAFTRHVVNKSELQNLQGIQGKDPDFITRLLKPIRRVSHIPKVKRTKPINSNN